MHEMILTLKWGEPILGQWVVG